MTSWSLPGSTVRDAYWKRYNARAESNRLLDFKHAKQVADSMRKETMKIADGPQRICITINMSQINDSIRETAIVELFPDRADYRRTSKQAGTKGRLEENLFTTFFLDRFIK